MHTLSMIYQSIVSTKTVTWVATLYQITVLLNVSGSEVLLASGANFKVSNAMEWLLFTSQWNLSKSTSIKQTLKRTIVRTPLPNFSWGLWLFWNLPSWRGRQNLKNTGGVEFYLGGRLYIIMIDVILIHINNLSVKCRISSWIDDFNW